MTATDLPAAARHCLQLAAQLDDDFAAGRYPSLLAVPPLDTANDWWLFAEHRQRRQAAKEARSAWLRRQIARHAERWPALADADRCAQRHGERLADGPPQPATLRPATQTGNRQHDARPWAQSDDARRFFAERVGPALAPMLPGQRGNDPARRPTASPLLAPFDADDPRSLDAWGRAWSAVVALNIGDWLGDNLRRPRRLLVAPLKRYKDNTGARNVLPTDGSAGALRLELWTPPSLHRLLAGPARAQAPAPTAADGRQASEHSLKHLSGAKDGAGIQHYSGLQISDLHLAVWLASAEQIGPALATESGAFRMPALPDEDERAHALLPAALQPLTPVDLAPLVRQLLPKAPVGHWFAPPAGRAAQIVAAGETATVRPVRGDFGFTADGRPQFDLHLPERIGDPPPAWIATWLLLRVGARYHGLPYRESDLAGRPDWLRLQLDVPAALCRLTRAQWQNIGQNLRCASRRRGRGLE